MGTTVAELTAIITADTSGFDSGVDSANQKLQELGQQGTQTGETFQKGLNVGGKAAMGIGAALLAPIVGATKLASGVEYAMDAVNAALGGVDTKTLDMLEDQAMDVAAASKFSVQEVAGVQEELAKSGLNAQDILGDTAKGIDGATESVINLAQATGEALLPSTRVVTSAMQKFGIEGENVSRVADIVTGGLNESSMTIDDYARGLNYLGPVLMNQARYQEMYAQGLDGGMEAMIDATTAQAMFNQQGLKGTDAGLSLARMYTELAANAEQYGLQVFDDMGNYKALPEIFEEIGKAMDGLSDKDRANAIADIFGQESKDVIEMLSRPGAFKDMAKNWDTLRDSIAEEGLAANQAAIRNDNLQSAVQSAMESAANLGVVMGKPLQEPLKKVAQFTNQVTDALRGAPEPIRNMVTGFATLTGGLLTAGGGLAYGTSKVLEMGAAFSKAGLSLPKFAGGLSLIGLAVGAGLLAYETNFMGFADLVDEKMADAGEAVQKFGDLFDEAFFENRNAEMGDLAAGIAAVGYALDGAFGTDVSKHTRKLAEGIDVLQDSFARGAALGIDPWVNALQSAAEASRAMGNEQLAKELYLGSKAWQAMTDSMTETEGQMDDAHRQLSALTAGVGMLVGPEGLGWFETNDGLTKAFDNIGSEVGRTRDDVHGFFEDIGALKDGGWDAVWADLFGGLDTTGIDNIGSELARTRDSITGFFDDLGELKDAAAANNWGVIWDDLTEGMDGLGTARDTLGENLQGISNDLTGWFQDTSDLLMGKDFNWSGGPGEREATKGLVQQLGDSLGQSFADLPNQVMQALPDTNPFEGVQQWLQDGMDEVSRFFQPQEMSAGLGGAGFGDTSGIDQMFTGMLDGIAAAIPTADDVKAVLGEKGGDFMSLIGDNLLGPLGQFLFPSEDAMAEGATLGDPSQIGKQFGTTLLNTFKDPKFAEELQKSVDAMPPEALQATGVALMGALNKGLESALTKPIEGGDAGETMGSQMVKTLGDGLASSLQAEGAADALIPAVNAFGSAFNTTLGKAMTSTIMPEGQTGRVGEAAAGGIGGKLVQSLADGLTTSLMTEGTAEKFIPAVNALGTVLNTAMQTASQGTQQVDGQDPTGQAATGFGQQMVQGLASGLANGITAADPAMFTPVTNALGTQLGAAMQLAAQPTQAPGGVGPQGPAVPAMGETMVQGLATGLANGISAADPAMFVPVSNALGTQLGAAMSMAAQQVQPPGGVGPVNPETGGMGTTMVQGLAQGLTDSITAAPVEMFHPVANALGSQLGTALNEAMTKTVGVGENTTGGMVGADAAGGIGAQMVQNLSTGLADSITNAPAEVFTPVGAALGTKMTEALQTAVEGGAQGGTGAEGAVTGVGQQMGEAVGQMLVSGVEQADWAPVGTSLSTKLGETLQTVAAEPGDSSKLLGDSVGSMLEQGVTDANFDAVGESLKTQLSTQMDTAIGDVATDISDSMKQITDAASQAISDMGEDIKGVVDDVKSAVDDMSSAISDATSDVTTAVQDMQTAVTDASTAMTDAATQASDAAADIGTAASDAATAVETAMQAMSAAVQAAAGAIAGAAGQIIGSLNAIAAAANAAAGAVGAVGGAGGGYTPAPATGGSGARSLEVGEAMVQGTAKGMVDGSPMVEQASQQVADVAYESMAKAIQMGSPAKRFEPVGASISQGMMKGMLADAKSRLKSAMGKMAGQVQSAMGKIKSAMASGISQVQSRIKEGMARAQGQAAAGGQAAGKAAAEGSAAGVDSASDENSKAIKRMWRKAVKKLLEGKGEMRFLGEEFAREFWLGMLDTSGSLEFAQFVTDQAVAAAENAIERIRALIQGLGTQLDIVTKKVSDLESELADIDSQLAAMDAAAAEEAAAAAAQARIDAAQDLLDKQREITAELEKQFSTEFDAAHQAHIRAVQAGSTGPAQAEYQAKLAQATQTNSLLNQSKAMEEHLVKELEMIRKAIEAEGKARAEAAKAAARAELEARREMLAAELEAAKRQQAEIAAAQHAAQVEYTQTVIAESEKRLKQLQREKQQADSPEERAQAQAEIALEKQKIELANQLAAALERQANAQTPEALAQANAQIQYYTEALAGLEEVDIGAMLQELVDKMGEVATAIGSAATAMDSAAASMSSMEEPAAAAASSVSEVGKATGTLGQQIEAATGGMFSMGAKYKEVMDKMNADGYAFQAQFKAMTDQQKLDAEAAGTAIGTSLSTGITDRITQGGPALQQAMVDGLNGAVTQGTDIASKGGTDIASAFGEEMRTELGVNFPPLQEQIRTGLQKPIDAGIKAAEDGGTDIGKGLMVEAKNGLDDKYVPWSNHAKKVIDDPIKDGIKAADKGGRDIGTAMGDGMLQGIRDRTAGIANEVRKTVADAVQAGHDAARNGSPSREMMEVGDFMGQGLEVGLRAHRKSAAEESEALIHIPRLSPTDDGGVTGNRARNSANNGGNVIHIGNVTLPGVTNPQEFLDAMAAMERRNGVSSGRR